ncbi:hypothetical protein I79_001316 [Cricetulus griseus]|uniref:Uncharacterized protein n=1 Tax=Cricetulus griseus TaxID=10029 RepID=G3GUF7_CRIGR|nr:hypothetical protein I79_001316 [Cricetulus griseus]
MEESLQGCVTESAIANSIYQFVCSQALVKALPVSMKVSIAVLKSFLIWVDIGQPINNIKG